MSSTLEPAEMAGSGLKRELGRPLEAELAGDGRLQPHPVLPQEAG